MHNLRSIYLHIRPESSKDDRSRVTWQLGTVSIQVLALLNLSKKY